MVFTFWQPNCLSLSEFDFCVSAYVAAHLSRQRFGAISRAMSCITTKAYEGWAVIMCLIISMLIPTSSSRHHLI